MALQASRILSQARLKAEWGAAPSPEEVNARDEARMMANPDWQMPITEAEEAGVAALVAGFSAEQIAASYLRLFRSMRSAPEELSDVEAKPAPRTEFGASVWFSVTGGHAVGAEPRRLLPMLCKAGGLTKDDVGAIRIAADQSYVQIREPMVPTFLSNVGDSLTLEEGAVVSQMATPPNLERRSRPTGKPGFSGKPRVERPGGPKPRSTPPVDWNDAPEPRVKKPKGAKPGGKPKPVGDRPNAAAAKSRPSGDKPYPVARKADDSKPARPGRPKSGPKGPPPPTGKPSSKKNRARGFAAPGAGKPGGAGKPHRKGNKTS